MATNFKLQTDRDFEQAMLKENKIRVFKNDYIINNGGLIVRFDDRMAVVQSGVSDISYYDRSECEFFEVKKS